MPYVFSGYAGANYSPKKAGKPWFAGQIIEPGPAEVLWLVVTNARHNLARYQADGKRFVRILPRDSRYPPPTANRTKNILHIGQLVYLHNINMLQDFQRPIQAPDGPAFIVSRPGWLFFGGGNSSAWQRTRTDQKFSRPTSSHHEKARGTFLIY
jgi:hypothetical protein